MRRRTFLAAGAATLAVPAWSAAQSPRFLSAASDDSSQTWIVGISSDAEVLFRLPVPGRGHAAAAHPVRAEAVAFARRPGRFAVVIDCTSGCEVARLESPQGLHFYGHGAFTADGRWLLTTENAFDAPDGRIGVWDSDAGYRRVGDFASGGIGPHEIIRLDDGTFAVANGGIQTHPDFGRKKLNLPTMRPNLSYLTAEGTLLERVTPPEALHRNSIRHLAADGAGRVVAATQWQGNPMELVPLVVSHRRGAPLEFLGHQDMVRLKQYAGSIAVDATGSDILVTGPKGGSVLRYSGAEPSGSLSLPVASGVAAIDGGFVVTVQGGIVALDRAGNTRRTAVAGLSWDNHLVAV